jgi:hypothetical protein
MHASVWIQGDPSLGGIVKLEDMPTGITDWSQVPPSTQPGESGTLTTRAQQFGEVQLRVVEYSANYVSNHWCSKGHVVYVLAGHCVIEHQDGRRYPLAPGMCYHVADTATAPHRLLSESGATVFILD